MHNAMAKSVCMYHGSVQYACSMALYSIIVKWRSGINTSPLQCRTPMQIYQYIILYYVGAGPGDPDPDQCSQPGFKKSVFTSNHVDLELLTTLVQLPGALTPHVRGSRVMGPHELPGCPTGDLPQLLHAPMGRYRGIGGPSTAELLDVTGQMPITQLLSHHRVLWPQVAGARSPQA